MTDGAVTDGAVTDGAATDGAVTEQTAQVAALFDMLAPAYDNSGVAFFGPIAAGLVGVLDPRPGERVLDVGCGRGALTLPAAAAVGPSGQVVGLDLSTALIDLCRAAVAAAGLTNVALVIDDAQAPALNGEFDVIASSLVLFFLPDPVAALGQWRRRLAPGGRCGVSSFAGRDDTLEAIHELFQRHQPPQPPPAAPSPFDSDEGVARLFNAAGYTDVRTVNREHATRFATIEQWEAFSRSTAQWALWRSIPQAGRAQLRADVERVLARSPHPDGGYVVRETIRYTVAVDNRALERLR